MSPDTDPPDSPPDRESAEATPSENELHRKNICELFQLNYVPLRKFLVSRGATRAEADDIASEAFKNLLSIKDPGSVSSLKRYLFSSAKNELISRVRRRKLHQRILPLFRYMSRAVSPSPEQSWIENERMDQLQREMQNLSPQYRAVVTLKLVHELSCAQIADWFADRGVEVHERTVQRYVADAVAQLRERIRAAESSRQERRK